MNSGELNWYKTPTLATAAVTLASATSPRDVAKPHTYLFRLDSDPTERHNLAAERPEIVEQLVARVEQYRAHMVPCEWRGDDAFAHEHLNANGFVGPWLRNSSAPPLSENCIAGFDIARPRRSRPL